MLRLSHSSRLSRSSRVSRAAEGVADGLACQYTETTFVENRPMVLIYESDPLDNEDARGRFYHVCRGRIDRTEIQLPADSKVYECAVCGIDLEAEDFWLARQKGSV